MPFDFATRNLRAIGAMTVRVQIPPVAPATLASMRLLEMELRDVAQSAIVPFLPVQPLPLLVATTDALLSTKTALFAVASSHVRGYAPDGAQTA